MELNKYGKINPPAPYTISDISAQFFARAFLLNIHKICVHISIENNKFSFESVILYKISLKSDFPFKKCRFIFISTEETQLKWENEPTYCLYEF